MSFIFGVLKYSLCSGSFAAQSLTQHLSVATAIDNLQPPLPCATLCKCHAIYL